MLSSRLASVSHKLESANDLAHGEEANDLSSYNAGVDYLLPVDVPDLIEDLARLQGACCSCGMGENVHRMPSCIDERLEVRLEGSHGGWAHFLALDDEFRQLESNPRVVDCRWDD